MSVRVTLAPVILMLGACASAQTNAHIADNARAQQAQPALEGDWWGTIQAGNQQLRVVVHFETGPTGYVGTLDSIDQGVAGLALANIEWDDASLSFDLPQVGGRYEGRWQDDKWVGTWTQGGGALPLTLMAGTPDAEASTAPVLPERWELPADEDVASRLAAAIGEAPGVLGAVALVDHGEARFVLSDGLDADRRFEIGSVTKVFTALLLADLVIDGTVGLDDPIGDYVEGIENEAVAAITLRQLSNHFSGLPRLPANLMPFVQLPDPYAHYDNTMLLDWIRTVEPERAPDVAYEYSNGGVGLLGHILGKAAGGDYKSALLERIVTPMGLDQTDFALDDRSIAGHNVAGEASAWTFKSLAPTGGLRSTIDDMARFAALLAAPPQEWQEHVSLITADQKIVQGRMTIGLGILTVPVTEGGVLFHNGGTGGFRSSLWADPETDRAAVVLINSNEPDPDILGSWLIAGLERNR